MEKRDSAVCYYWSVHAFRRILADSIRTTLFLFSRKYASGMLCIFLFCDGGRETYCSYLRRERFLSLLSLVTGVNEPKFTLMVVLYLKIKFVMSNPSSFVHLIEYAGEANLNRLKEMCL